MQHLIFLGQNLKRLQRFGHLFRHFCHFLTFLSLVSMFLLIFFSLFLFLKLSHKFVSLFQHSFISFSLNAIQLNKTPKFNESRELIIYVACEERCMEPSMLFFLNYFWLKETQISETETF